MKVMNEIPAPKDGVVTEILILTKKWLSLVKDWYVSNDRYSRNQRSLPHRYPLLLVDRVLEVSEDTIVAIKNVTINEPFFNGHFPQYPVMPGVLIMELWRKQLVFWNCLSLKIRGN